MKKNLTTVLLFIYIYFILNTANAQKTGVGVMGSLGTYLYQQPLQMKNGLLSHMVYGINSCIGSRSDYFNFRMNYVYHRAIIEYPVQNDVSIFRKETTTAYFLGLRINPFARSKFHPFIEENLGLVMMNVYTYSNDEGINHSLPARSFRLNARPMLQVSLGYSFSHKGFRLEPFIQTFVQSKNAYPYFLRCYAGLNFGYYFFEQVNKPD